MVFSCFPAPQEGHFLELAVAFASCRSGQQPTRRRGREERHLHVYLGRWSRAVEVEMRSGSRHRRERTQPPSQPQWAKTGRKAKALDVRCLLLHLAPPLGQYAHHRIVAMCCTCFPQVVLKDPFHPCRPMWAMLLATLPDGNSGWTCCPVHLGAVVRGMLRTTSRLKSGFAARVFQMLSPLGLCIPEWHYHQHSWNQQVASRMWQSWPRHRPRWLR